MIVKNIIFDLDGTLIDSMRVWDDLGERYLRSVGREPRKGLSDELKTMSLAQAADYLKREYGLTDSCGRIVDGINELIRDFYKKEACLKPGVREALDAFRARGVRMCVATASMRELSEAALERNGILDCFDAIFTCGEIEMDKGTPAFFEEVLRRFNADKEETAVFEDAAHAALAAKKAGIYVIGVRDAAENAENMKTICDLYVDKMDEACASETERINRRRIWI